MTILTPAPPCNSEFPLLCEPLETTSNAKRLVVEDSAACPKTIQTPASGQLLTSNKGTLEWTSGLSNSIISKNASGEIQFNDGSIQYPIELPNLQKHTPNNVPLQLAMMSDGTVKAWQPTATGADYIATWDGSNWKLQTISTSIPDKSVTNEKLRDSVSTSVIGRTQSSSGTPADIQATFDGAVLKREGTSLIFNTLDYRSVQSGFVVNHVNASTTNSFSITSVIPLDNTVPQISEGGQIITASINLKKATNKVFGIISFNGDASGAALPAVCAVFRNAEPSAIASTWCQSLANASLMYLDFNDSPNTTNLVTYSVRIGPGSAGTVYVNQNNTSQLLGETNFIRFNLFEINN